MRNLEGEHLSSESDGNGSQQYTQPSQSQYDPAQYPSHPGTPGVDMSAESGSLAPNVVAMLSYLLFGWVGGLIMYLEGYAKLGGELSDHVADLLEHQLLIMFSRGFA
jgi:hypothetical protein